MIERGINKVSIPWRFVKVALDLKAQQGIAFVMDNKKLLKPLSQFAISIDEAERLTGYDFFNKLQTDLQASIEFTIDKTYWFPELASGDVEPLYPPDLPQGHFNTVQAQLYVDNKKRITVCGTVVSGRTTRKGNVLLNLDRNHPNEIFSVFIPKDQLVNFSYDPVQALLNGTYCFKGQVKGFMGWPVMQVAREVNVSQLEERK